MITLRTYRWFNLLKGLVAPLMLVVLVGSQFPLSSHCYEILFGSQHSGKMVCMKDGACMMNMAGGQKMSCDCHAKNGDRPFFCSCNSSAKMTFSLQISKMLLPNWVSGAQNLPSQFYTSTFNNPDLASHTRDIFHPPQAA